MKIVDIDESTVPTYCKCLEDWSEEFADAGSHKLEWYEKSKKNGLRVKLAKDEENRTVGMIHYIPIEYSPVEGKDSYYVYCVWVHGYKEGVGNNQKKGVGKALLNAAEEDVRALGGKALVAWGIRMPFFMRSSWFKKQGYKHADGSGMMELVIKEFDGPVEKPRFIAQKAKPESGKDRVNLTCFLNGWCPSQAMVYERAKRIAAEFPEKVEFVPVDTFEKAAIREYGIADALFVDGKPVMNGPPLSYGKLKAIVEKRIKKRKL